VPRRIQELQTQHFSKADPAYGQGVAKGLGWKSRVRSSKQARGRGRLAPDSIVGLSGSCTLRGQRKRGKLCRLPRFVLGSEAVLSLGGLRNGFDLWKPQCLKASRIGGGSGAAEAVSFQSGRTFVLRRFREPPGRHYQAGSRHNEAVLFMSNPSVP